MIDIFRLRPGLSLEMLPEVVIKVIVFRMFRNLYQRLYKPDDNRDGTRLL